VCAVINLVGNLQFGYVFSFGLDQTYDGLWLSSDGMTTNPMKGFKVVSKSGFAKATVVDASAIPTAQIPLERGGDLGDAVAKEQTIPAVVGNALQRALAAR
jgi:hypothetical protein